ncbi:hypothetical protein D5F11_007205 [Siminovitchia terrae]|uniref:Uncharacterized protein n=1 Tax=Siminovitchia terrae TaxID=1914933 RepID=A0A429XA23_SIMTE|nr:hypothetical protein [Siminovitchia terrae]RST60236.1 hypothetical protein D5F11_007205 [Siminovitchia terrae]
MKTVFVISLNSKKIPDGFDIIISKNEPSRAQIEELITFIGFGLEEKWNLNYVNFQQDPGKWKIYEYEIDTVECFIVVEREKVIEFPK